MTAAHDPAERPAFARALLDSHVFVLGSIDPPPVDGTAAPGAKANILFLHDAEGPITPFFTSEDALRHTVSVRPETDPQYLRMPCRALFEMTQGARLVLNPDAPYGKVYLPDEVASLLAGTEIGLDAHVLRAGEQVRVGVPAHIPPALPEVLARYLVQRPAVSAAHLGWIAHPDGHQAFLVVIVATDRDAAMDGFGTLSIGELTEGQPFEVIVASPDEPHHALSSVPPFYVRPEQQDVPPDPPRRRRFRRS